MSRRPIPNATSVEYQVMAAGKDENERPHINERCVGAVFIFGYSGSLITRRESDFAVANIARAGFEIAIPAPQRVADANWRPIPQLDIHKLGRITASQPNTIDHFRLAAMPQVEEDGSIKMELHWGAEAENWNSLPKDTFLVFVYGKDALDKGGSVAGQVLSELFDWLRVLSAQWWIGKPTEAMTGNLQVVLPMSDIGHVSDFPIVQARNTAPAPGTKVILPQLWKQAIDRVRAGKRPPTSELLILDAAHLYASDDHRLALVIVCSAYEMARDEALERRGIGKNRLKASDTDLLRHVRVDMLTLLNRSLEKEEPELYEFLKSLWIARGHVAHGQNIVWVHKGKRLDFSTVTSEEFYSNTSAIMSWFKTI